ncbi:hypothetical protein JCM11491_003187 [Sporobolomyces phaffii]
MPPKSKKGQKMDLSAFLADENTGGSWADEMDTLPTGPSAAGLDGGVGLGGSHLTRNMRGGPEGPGGFGGRDRYDDGRPQRVEVPIPTEPPYTTFVGNLTFEVVEADLADFFTGLSVKSIRLVSGQDGKPRGFGYVEFNTVDDLKNALTLSGQDLNGRVVRISVAEASAARTGRADEASSWERTGPLPALGGRSGGFGAPRSGGFERREGGGGFDEVEREGPIRGGKFIPSAPAPDRGFGGGFQARGGDRQDRGPGFSGFERAPVAEIEREGPIRGGKFTPSQPEAPRRTFSGAGGEPSRADDGPWARGGALPPPPAGSERRGFGSGFGSRENSSSEIPIARRPLQLAARSASTTAIAPNSATPSPSATPKSNPFGSAKPIDTATKEKEVEEKLAKERAERAAALQQEREAKEKAQAEQKKDQPDAAKSDGDWVRRGPLPQRQRSDQGAKKQPLAPPVPIVSTPAASASSESSTKDQPPHAAAKPAWGKKTDTDEITQGVAETQI